jgi:steroid delta-isomerase-like uncharacterized protein
MKNPFLVVSLVVLLCFVFGCQNKAEKAQLEKFKAQGKLEEQNKEVVGNFFAAIDKNDFDKLKQLSADDFSFREPGMVEPIGFDTLIQVIKTHYAAFPDWKHTIEEMIAEGNIVAIRLVQNGTHKAPYEGIPPTNKEVTMQALFFCEVVNGRVKGGWAIEDYLGLYQQLGMELKHRQEEKK